MVSLDAFRAQRRRAAAAAQAHARLRTMIAVALVIAGLVAGIYSRHREAELQRIERW